MIGFAFFLSPSQGKGRGKKWEGAFRGKIGRQQSTRQTAKYLSSFEGERGWKHIIRLSSIYWILGS
tara:strand:- start:540 stop:737 length:198 start_codon:yes stop_codon:yes gene_type:complete